MKIAGKQTVTGVVLDSRPTKDGSKLIVNVQVMGGGPETLFVDADQRSRFEPGSTHDLDVTYRRFGEAVQTRERDGKTYTDRLTTYVMSVFLSRRDDAARSPREVPPARAA